MTEPIANPTDRAPRRCRSSCRRSPRSPRSTSLLPSRRRWPSSWPRSQPSPAPIRAATFANTVEALERSGQALRRAAGVFYCLSSAAATPGIRAVETEFAPRLAAHDDAIHLDPALFARLDAVHSERATADLDPEALRLVERLHTDFVLAGAGLDEVGRDELRRLNQEIAATLHPVRPDPGRGDGGGRGAGRGPGRAGRAQRRRDRRRGGRGPDAGPRDRLPHPAGAADAPAMLAVLRNRDLRRRVFEASVDRGRVERRRAPPPRSRPCRSPSCGPSGPRCWASPTTPTRSSSTRPPAPAPPWTPCWPSWSDRPWPTPAAEAAMLAEYARARRDRTGAVGLGVLRRAGPGRAVRRRHRRPAALLRARTRPARRRVLRRDPACTGSRSRPGRTWSGTTPTCGCGRCATRTAPRSGCTSATTSPARASAAGRG